MDVSVRTQAFSLSYPSRGLLAAGLLAASMTVSMTACMVVPLDPQRPLPTTPSVVVQQGGTPVVVQSPVSTAPPAPQLLAVRLYPLNAEANKAGALSANVLDTQGGRGHFTIAYQGRTLQGEATRVGNEYPGFGTLLGGTEVAARTSGRRGIANAAGPGLNAQCEYILTGGAQGIGACLFSDGARYQMHFGQ